MTVTTQPAKPEDPKVPQRVFKSPLFEANEAWIWPLMSSLVLIQTDSTLYSDRKAVSR